MYSVAIIDDEPLIVEGLSKTMAWDKWDCQVIGTACDGMEGMALVREKKPDIVITDINMPKMDGLKMIAGLKSEFPDMQLIILTGYREFEYARQAIGLGVSRFLLKPSRMNELEEAVETVTAGPAALPGARANAGERGCACGQRGAGGNFRKFGGEQRGQQLYREECAGIYSGELAGEAAAFGCG